MLARSRCGALLILVGAGLVLAGPFVVGYRLSRANRATAPVAIPSVVDQVREALAARYYRPVPRQRAAARLGRRDHLGARRPVHRVPRAAGLPARAAGDRVELLRHRRQRAAVAERLRRRLDAPGPRAARRRARRRHDRAHRRRAGAGPQRGEGARAASSARAARVFELAARRAAGTDARPAGAPRASIHAPVVQARLLSYAGSRWGVRAAVARSASAPRSCSAASCGGSSAQGAQGFVLDLRQNPGGLLDQAVAVSSLFLDRGVVVSLVGRAPAARGVPRDRRHRHAAAARRARRPLQRELVRDRRRRAPRQPPRDARRRADVRQGARPVDRPARQRRGARADDRALLHARRRRTSRTSASCRRSTRSTIRGRRRTRRSPPRCACWRGPPCVATVAPWPTAPKTTEPERAAPAAAAAAAQVDLRPDRPAAASARPSRRR